MHDRTAQHAANEELLVTFRDVPGRIDDVVIYKDRNFSALSEAVCSRFSGAGPIFRNHGGRAVKYEDLDFDLQCSLLTYYVFPMDSEEAREAFDRSFQAEKGEEERRQREVEMTRLRAILHARGEDVEMEDVGEEMGVPASTAAYGEQRGTADKSHRTLSSRSLAQTAASGPGDGRGQTVDRSHPALYERLVWEDESKTQIRRRQPSVERWWHASKLRSAERAQRVQDLGLDVFTPYARDVKRREQLEIQGRWETHIAVRP